MIHHDAGRHAWTPATIPDEYESAAQSIGWRGALKRKAEGEVGEGAVIVLGELAVKREDLRDQASASEMHDALDMVGLREQVHQMQLLDAIPGCEQSYEIAGQRCRVA